MRFCASCERRRRALKKLSQPARVAIAKAANAAFKQGRGIVSGINWNPKNKGTSK